MSLTTGEERQLVKNAADREQVERAARTIKDAAKLDDAALVAVMATPAGRRFMWQQLVRAKCFALSWTGELTHTTTFNEGRRSLGLELLADIDRLCPERFDEMRREARQRAPRTP